MSGLRMSGLRLRTLEVLKEYKKGLSANQINKLVHTTEARKIISDLRNVYKITDVWVKGEIYGRKVRYKIYKLEE